MGRAPCCAKVGLNRGPWSIEEDRLLAHYIQTHGEGHWRALPSNAGLLRCGKSCRLRWVNYLRPGVKRGNFTSDENDTIIRLHSLHGNRWSLIAAEFPGRTDNEIKNHWNTHLRKKAAAALLPTTSAVTTAATTTDHTDHDQSRADVGSTVASQPITATLQSNNVNVDTYHELPTTDAVSGDSTQIAVDPPTKIVSLPELYSDEDDQKENTSSDHSCGQVLTDDDRSTKVNRLATPNNIVDQGGVDYEIGMTSIKKMVTADMFFFELDDLLEVDDEIDDQFCGSMLREIDGNEQLEGLYMEYFQLLDSGSE